MTTAIHEETLLDALRSNVRVLGELAMRYGIETQPGRPAAEPPIISSAEDARRLLVPEMAPLAQEQVRVLLLDIRNRLVGQRVIYQGTVSSTEVRTAEVLRPAVNEAAPRIIVVHNHPSGAAEPSPEDVALTRRLVQAAELLGIELLDHVVIGRNEAVSLKEWGHMST